MSARLALLALLLATRALAGESADLPLAWLAQADLTPKSIPGGPMGHNPSEETRCEACHTAQSWSEAAFAHDRTGFPLQGQHATTRCQNCHVKDSTTPVSRMCSGCHRDPHEGDFGRRCEGCHDAQSWKAFFDVDAHRRTNFPLVGRHAILPCTECHTNMLNNRFSRQTVDCVACHQVDYNSTVATPVNHLVLGFSTQCRDCHSAFRFKGAHFAKHNDCFLITSGPHSGIECMNCHTTLAGAQANGTCATNSAACSNCHVHLCAQMTTIHANVAGFQCKDRKCYECHRFAQGP